MSAPTRTPALHYQITVSRSPIQTPRQKAVAASALAVWAAVLGALWGRRA